jgi:hypothetical protein
MHYIETQYVPALETWHIENITYGAYSVSPVALEGIVAIGMTGNVGVPVVDVEMLDPEVEVEVVVELEVDVPVLVTLSCTLFK